MLGIQFTPVSSYTSVHGNDVWALFREEFRLVQEHPPLEPKFETFGGVNPTSGIEFLVRPPPARGRLWFLSAQENHLIQFQEDRLLLNWRRRPNAEGYPRIEGIASNFRDYVQRLDKYVLETFGHQLEINQAEICYFNVIPVEEFFHVDDWLKLWGCDRLNIEGININFSEVIRDEDDVAYARLSHDIQSAYTTKGKEKALRFALTFRGRPENTDANARMEIIHKGRDVIVTRFSEITTNKAHQIWRRQK